MEKQGLIEKQGQSKETSYILSKHILRPEILNFAIDFIGPLRPIAPIAAGPIAAQTCGHCGPRWAACEGQWLQASNESRLIAWAAMAATAGKYMG